MNAREEILSRVRKARETADLQAVPGAYRRQWDTQSSDRIARFEQRLKDYGVGVMRIADQAGIAAAAAERLAQLGISRLLVPADLPTEWRPDNLAVVADTGEDARALESYDGVMTGCAVAVAETGTIALDAGVAQGRRAITLVPDYYLCVVLPDQLVGLVPEAIARLAPAARDGRPITFISGPSATADIELNRVAGVHGPRRLDVILVG